MIVSHKRDQLIGGALPTVEHIDVSYDAIVCIACLAGGDKPHPYETGVPFKM